jgi:hypothetical protein
LHDRIVIRDLRPQGMEAQVFVANAIVEMLFDPVEFLLLIL